MNKQNLEIYYNKSAHDDKIYYQSKNKFLDLINLIPFYNEINKILSPYVNSTKSLLEIGCGNGNYIKKFNKLTKIDLVDLSNEYLKVTYQKIKNKLPTSDINIFNIDINHFKYSKKYDLILCIGVINHLDEDEVNRFIIKACETSSNNIIIAYAHNKFLLHSFLGREFKKNNITYKAHNSTFIQKQFKKHDYKLKRKKYVLFSFISPMIIQVYCKKQ